MRKIVSWENFFELVFFRKFSSLELEFLDFFHSETPYSPPSLLNCFDREFVLNQKKCTTFCVYDHCSTCINTGYTKCLQEIDDYLKRKGFPIKSYQHPQIRGQICQNQESAKFDNIFSKFTNSNFCNFSRRNFKQKFL